MKKDNNIASLQEKLKILQSSDVQTLKDLKKVLTEELEAEVTIRKQQIELIDKLIRNKEKLI